MSNYSDSFELKTISSATILATKYETAVYFLFEPDTRIVRYIGISRKPKQRFKQHKINPKFSGLYCYIVEWFEDAYIYGIERLLIDKYIGQLLNDNTDIEIDNGKTIEDIVREFNSLIIGTKFLVNEENKYCEAYANWWVTDFSFLLYPYDEIKYKQLDKFIVEHPESAFMLRRSDPDDIIGRRTGWYTGMMIKSGLGWLCEFAKNYQCSSGK